MPGTRYFDYLVCTACERRSTYFVCVRVIVIDEGTENRGRMGAIKRDVPVVHLHCLLSQCEMRMLGATVFVE